MAHLWFRGDEDIWTVMPLDGHAVDVSVYPPRVLAEGFRLGADTLAAVVRAEAGDSPVWALVVAGEGDVRVNGFAPVAGLRVLQNRDEIRAAWSGALFFSTETLARVEEFAAAERAIFCGRCRQPMQNTQMAVRCPQCGIWYHQIPEKDLPCWTYAPSCAFCPQPTSLDAAFDWIPEA
jgi:hypothetical protein